MLACHRGADPFVEFYCENGVGIIASSSQFGISRSRSVTCDGHELLPSYALVHVVFSQHITYDLISVCYIREVYRAR
eukprot:255969-Pleurochrysis_carterae.AAC.1